jgi:8-oxo-dGTP pyrophosphatase MutT (NUDIX family)/phosphohistidine phosphatase SixA
VAALNRRDMTATEPPDADVIRAAGGVLCRPAAGGPETCLVHRPRYDDWSLPKGKLSKGEHPLAAAIREVAEETAVRGVPQVRLPTVRYLMRGGGPKSVDYWLMQARESAPFHPNAEVDRVRWVPLATAAEHVSYAHDAQVVRHAAALPPVTATVLLVRHGYAGERDEWSGPDAVRPLEATGVAQAEAMAALLRLFDPRRLVSATPDRCVQTLKPLAVSTGVPIEPDASFDETADPDRSAARLRALATGPREPVVVCSQGKLIPRVLARIAAEGHAVYATPKGTGWLLGFAGDRLAGADRIAPMALD